MQEYICGCPIYTTTLNIWHKDSFWEVGILDGLYTVLQEAYPLQSNFLPPPMLLENVPFMHLYVECGACGKVINPMTVSWIINLATKE